MASIPFDGSGFMFQHNSHRVEFRKQGTYQITIVGSSFPGSVIHSLCFEYKEGSGEPRPEPPCYPQPQGTYTQMVRATNLLTLWKAPAEVDLVAGYYVDASKRRAHLRWAIEGMDLVVEVEDLNP